MKLNKTTTKVKGEQEIMNIQTEGKFHLSRSDVEREGAPKNRY